MSNDDQWSDVIEQVLTALDEADVADHSTRDALADGVRAALDAMSAGEGIDVQIIGHEPVAPDSGRPEVEVVPGGRASDDPRTAGERPTLRIAEPDEAGAADETPPVVTRVHVNRRETAAPRFADLAHSGQIRVTGDGPPESRWQTVYSGARSRLYRVACSAGTLDVSVDGAAVERLAVGQSIDTAGRAIRVSTDDPGEGRGLYVRIQEWGNEE
ncbi:MAG: hypothetical protein VX944_12255 [Myxococcota bacterium]|nr:hypothetical protein [Myxococcota bacterium]MEC9390837.1 hypothetical protein [Myxococcota bacterium]